MNLEILDFICDGYCYHFRAGKKIPEIQEFREKYIYPLLEQDHKAGIEMEEMFNVSLSESDTQAFKTGFRRCIYFLMECLHEDSYENETEILL